MAKPQESQGLALYLHPIFDSDKLCQTDARIRSLIFAGYHPWASACYAEQVASSPIYAGWPCFAFRCYGWMRTPSTKKSLSASMPNESVLKKESGIASNDQSIRIGSIGKRTLLDMTCQCLCKSPFAHPSKCPYPASKLACRGHIGYDRSLAKVTREVPPSLYEPLYTGRCMARYSERDARVV